jgi:hemoglobin
MQHSSGPPDRSASLYERLGGDEAVLHLVGEFYRRVLADEILSPFFANTPMKRLERMQLEFFSAALGGPVHYTGRPLSEAHAGRGIERRHMQRFLDHLFGALETLTQAPADSPSHLRLDDQDKLEIISRINTYVAEITGEGPMVG